MTTANEQRRHRVKQLENFLDEHAPCDLRKVMKFFDQRFTKDKIDEYLEGLDYERDSSSNEIRKIDD